MAATPRLTANRGLHHFFTAFDRGHVGTTEVVLLNNGGRSKLTVVHYDGQTKRIAPTMHRAFGLDIDAAALIAARAVYGPRPQWPTRITLSRPSEPLIAGDAAPHLGDHVLNNRVYTVGPAAADAAHNVMSCRQLVSLGIREPYDRACSTLARLVGMPEGAASRDVFSLARSYTRRHPVTAGYARNTAKPRIRQVPGASLCSGRSEYHISVIR